MNNQAPEAVNATPLGTGEASMAVTLSPTQVRRPWRSMIRTIFQALVGIAPMAPLIYSAATQHDPALATGWVALALAISGAITRVMTLPQVEMFLRTFLPFLAAAPNPKVSEKRFLGEPT